MFKRIFALFLAVSVTGCAAFGSQYSTVGVPYVNEPRDERKHPAVIILHTHSGLYPHQQEYARFLTSHGYVTAVVDYYANGGTDNVGKAYDILSKHPKVDPKKIALLGFSKGAKIAIDQSNWEDRFGTRKYAAIVSYYIGPYPGSNSETLPPILFLHGDKDNYVSEQTINKFCEIQKRYKQECQAEIYKNVTHAFDNIPAQRGGHGKYDGLATTKARGSTVKFLDKHLK